VTGGGGIDTLLGIENLTGSAFNDVLTGSAAANVLDGGAGSDNLAGGLGNDSLTGGVGADTLAGGGGVDLLDGGAGADRFVFTAPADSGTGVNRDVILAFEGVGAVLLDQIDLSLIDANGGAAGNQAFSFIGATDFGGIAGQLRVFDSGGNSVVAGDINGDKVADFEIQVNGAAAASWVAADFIL
jgi:Ca2+-binding RTX toxin-like protein